MSKTVTIKLTRVGLKHGPFLIKDEYGNVLAENVPRKSLMQGQNYLVDDLSQTIVIESTGECQFTKAFSIGTITTEEFYKSEAQIHKTSCMWEHLLDYTLYNNFYGKIEPYIIEYPFAYQYEDEILQNVKDYTKSYKYFNNGFFDDSARIEVEGYFNKAVVYNNLQSSGLLLLVSKPKNNLQVYSQYPKYNSDSKTILYTKSDSFYNYNTFWSIVKDKQQPLFVKSCKSMSIDKEINQINMDYSARSFTKAPLRAKELKIRSILDNRSDLLLVSQMFIVQSQISHK